LHCREDAAVPVSEGRLIAARIPGAKFVELQGRNHVVTSGEPAWPLFLREVGDFLDWESKPTRPFRMSHLQSNA
jgi:hypothetical protein